MKVKLPCCYCRKRAGFEVAEATAAFAFRCPGCETVFRVEFLRVEKVVVERKDGSLLGDSYRVFVRHRPADSVEIQTLEYDPTSAERPEIFPRDRLGVVRQDGKLRAVANLTRDIWVPATAFHEMGFFEGLKDLLTPGKKR